MRLVIDQKQLKPALAKNEVSCRYEELQCDFAQRQNDNEG